MKHCKLIAINFAKTAFQVCAFDEIMRSKLTPNLSENDL